MKTGISMFMIILTTTAVWGDLPPLPESMAETSAFEQVSLLCSPDGTGRSLTEAMTRWGGVVDATVTVTLRSWNYDPIPNYPAEDIWLESTSGGMSACLGGAIADGPTDVHGQTRFTVPLQAGGHTDPVAGEKLQVVVNGSPLSASRLDIQINSPDLDGDLDVDLTDVVIFVQSYFSGNDDYAVDFHCDGSINLSDLVVMASHVNVTCP